MEVRIIRIDGTNAEVLENIASEVFDYEIDPEYLADFLEDHNHLMCVAVVNGQVVGQIRALLCRHPDKPRELYIDDLGVSPVHRRKGIATQLVSEARRFGRERNCREVWLGTEGDNEPAKSFYRSLDLTEEAFVLFYDTVDKGKR